MAGRARYPCNRFTNYPCHGLTHRRSQTAGARGQATATGSTRGTQTNAARSTIRMESGSQGGSSRNAAPGRTIAATDDVVSPFVKNDGSASEYVKAELAFYGRTLMGLLCMEAEYQFGPLHYRDKEVASRPGVSLTCFGSFPHTCFPPWSRCFPHPSMLS